MPPWRGVKHSPIPLFVLLTVVFFGLDFDSRCAHIKWVGIVKYINYALRCTIVVCAILFVFGYYRKKRAYLMKPIVYVLGFVVGFGIGFGLTSAFSSGQTMIQSTHIEVLNISSTSASNIDVTTNGQNSTMKLSSVHGFFIIRTVICLVFSIFYYFAYSYRVAEWKRQEQDIADLHN